MARKRELKKVDYVAKKYGLDRVAFGELLHALKEAGDGGTKNDRGDFTDEELERIAQDMSGQADE